MIVKELCIRGCVGDAGAPAYNGQKASGRREAMMTEVDSALAKCWAVYKHGEAGSIDNTANDKHELIVGQHVRASKHLTRETNMGLNNGVGGLATTQ